MGTFSLGAELKPEFQVLGMNPFLEALDANFHQPPPSKPIQLFHNKLKQLERVSNAGDLKAWQKEVPALKALASDAGMDWEENLELQVKMMQLELTLLLQAGKLAQRKAQFMKQQASANQIKAPSADAQQLFHQAGRYQQMGEQLLEQLRVKIGC